MIEIAAEAEVDAGRYALADSFRWLPQLPTCRRWDEQQQCARENPCWQKAGSAHRPIESLRGSHGHLQASGRCEKLFGFVIYSYICT